MMAGNTIYGSDIPEAREQLACLGLEMRDAGHIEWSSRICDIIVTLMRQTRADKITRKKRRSPTTEQEVQVIDLRRNTDMSVQEIANRVGLNPGRVSEIVHKYDDVIHVLHEETA